MISVWRDDGVRPALPLATYPSLSPSPTGHMRSRCSRNCNSSPCRCPCDRRRQRFDRTRCPNTGKFARSNLSFGTCLYEVGVHGRLGDGCGRNGRDIHKTLDVFVRARVRTCVRVCVHARSRHPGFRSRGFVLQICGFLPYRSGGAVGHWKRPPYALEEAPRPPSPICFRGGFMRQKLRL